MKIDRSWIRSIYLFEPEVAIEFYPSASQINFTDMIDQVLGAVTEDLIFAEVSEITGLQDQNPIP
jgi:hypothetical protein